MIYNFYLNFWIGKKIFIKSPTVGVIRMQGKFEYNAKTFS